MSPCTAGHSAPHHILLAEAAGARPTYHRAVSNGLSNNFNALGASGASTTQLRHAQCQAVLLLSGGL
jgi:hypothetical protein